MQGRAALDAKETTGNEEYDCVDQPAHKPASMNFLENLRDTKARMPRMPRMSRMSSKPKAAPRKGQPPSRAPQQGNATARGRPAATTQHVQHSMQQGLDLSSMYAYVAAGWAHERAELPRALNAAARLPAPLTAARGGSRRPSTQTRASKKLRKPGKPRAVGSRYPQRTRRRKRT